LYLVELTIKIVALGTVPNNRRLSSSIVWLLLIVVTPIFGLVIFLLIWQPVCEGPTSQGAGRGEPGNNRT
jgi:cardiolipin synthase A/B